VVEVCRQVGITEQTFYTWKRTYAELGLSELRRSPYNPAFGVRRMPVAWYLAPRAIDIRPGSDSFGAHPNRPVSIAMLVAWSKWEPLKESFIPAPLAVVLLGVGASLWFEQLGDPWLIKPSHFVQVPVADSLAGFLGFLQLPDFSQWANPAVYAAAATIAVAASLETLLNLQAADKIEQVLVKCYEVLITPVRSMKKVSTLRFGNRARMFFWMAWCSSL